MDDAKVRTTVDLNLDELQRKIGYIEGVAEALSLTANKPISDALFGWCEAMDLMIAENLEKKYGI